MPRSPREGLASSGYDSAWAAITELIRGDESWSGRERNICYLNNGDGTFSDISGAAGLDFMDDGRSFAAGDLDGDGDLDLVLKSSNEPGIRIVRNDWSDGRSVMVQLEGARGNRDAIGAEVSFRTGTRLVTRTLRAGSGFLSQHAKPLHLGVGTSGRIDELRVRWPSGADQVLRDVRAGELLTVAEGSNDVIRVPLAKSRADDGSEEPLAAQLADPEPPGTWLIEPVPAPSWSLSDLHGGRAALADYRGAPLVINVWATWCPPCRAELRDFQRNLVEFKAQGVPIVAVSVDEPGSEAEVSAFVRKEGLQFPVLLADDRFVTAHTVLRRHLLNRRSDLTIPTTFLVSGAGLVEEVYLGAVQAERVLADAAFVGEPAMQRLPRALPMSGRYFGPTPRRDPLPLGAAMLEAGLPEEAVPHLAISASLNPSDPSVHFNLGTAHASNNSLHAAQAAFETAVRLDPSHAEARNSLGVVFGRLGMRDEAIVQFREALAQRPQYVKAVGNLATALERSGRANEAIDALEAAVAVHPHSHDLRNRLGLLHARRGELDLAETWFLDALQVALGDANTRINLALLAAQRGRLGDAGAQLAEIISSHPDLHEAYLALARVQVQAGDVEAARATLADLLRNRPGHRQGLLMLEGLGE